MDRIGGALGGKTALKEFGLKQNDIISTIKEGELQYENRF